LWVLLLEGKTLEACRLLLNRRKLLRPWICERSTRIVHKILLLEARRLLGNSSLRGVLEAILHTVGELEVLWLIYHANILLGAIEASVLLLHPHIVQALTWRGNLRLESSRSLHPGGLWLQRRQREPTELICVWCR
jgi:hypothetical protein